MTWESANAGAIEHGFDRNPNKQLLQALLTREPGMRKPQRQVGLAKRIQVAAYKCRDHLDRKSLKLHG